MKKLLKRFGCKKCTITCGAILILLIVVEVATCTLYPINSIPFNLLIGVTLLFIPAFVLFLQGAWEK